MAISFSDVCLALLGFVLLFSINCTLADDTLRRELLARIESLEKQVQGQATILLEQSNIIEQMDSKLNSQNEKIAIQQQTISDFEERILELEQTVQTLINVEEHTHAYIINSEDTLGTIRNDQTKDVQQSNIETGSTKDLVSFRKKRLVREGDGQVAFHAVIKNNVVTHIGINQRIVFSDMMINLGGGYHNQHGLFIAPRPGLYVFSLSIMSYNAVHVDIYVHLMKNGNILSNAYAHGDSGRHDQGSISVVTQLSTGDEVWVGLYGPADTSLWL